MPNAGRFLTRCVVLQGYYLEDDLERYLTAFEYFEEAEKKSW
jgi:hypothetical protein